MILFAQRACTIIYNYLLSNDSGSGYWLIPINSCPVVPITFLTAGVPFKLVDIEQETYCMDRKWIMESIRDPECKGMIYIYSYGLEISMDSLFKRIKNERPDFRIIEDKCLGSPSFDESDASVYSDLCLYSTGYSKFADVGYGGFAVHHYPVKYTHHSTQFDKAHLRNIEYEYKKCLKRNETIKKPDPAWLDDRPLLQDEQVYVRAVMTQKEKINQKKETINSIYKASIPEKYWLCANGLPVDSWRFNILVPSARDEVLKEIFRNNLFAGSHFQPVEKLFDVPVVGSGNTARSIYKRVLNLFNDKYFSINQAKFVSNIIGHVLQEEIKDEYTLQ